MKDEKGSVVGRADELREKRLQYLCLRKKKAPHVAKAEFKAGEQYNSVCVFNFTETHDN